MAPKRLDIQALRGYAVIIVVLFHAGLGWVPAGFIGVDVFFVISGFLITGIIDRQLEQGVFSLPAFYIRRLQRLLPAAYVTFLLTAIAAGFLLTSIELRDFSRQLIGAVTFTANYALKNQTGYFDGAADLKPLLHAWTLSVEEQFYLLIPVLLLLIPRGSHGLLFFVLTVCSLAANLYGHAQPQTVFYTLPYRAWELSLGASAARLFTSASAPLLSKIKAHWLAWSVLLIIPFVPEIDTQRPWLVIMACLSTALILLIPSVPSPKNPLFRGLTWTGDISYSLYLVHWPLFAFLNNMTIITGYWDTLIRGGLLAAAFLLALLLHHGIERPFLLNAFSRRTVLLGSVIGACLLIATGIWVLQPLSLATGFLELRNEDQGLGQICSALEPYERNACHSGSNPRMLIWGDSMAMQLVNGIVASGPPDVAIEQATRGTCAPFLHLTYTHTPGGEGNCLRFNQSVLKELEKSESIDVVVLSARWAHYLRPNVSLHVFKEDQPSEVKGEGVHSALIEALGETIHSIREAGKRVVLIDAPPSAAYDVSRCIERSHRNLLTLGIVEDCAIPNDQYRQLNITNISILDDALKLLNVSFIHFDDVLCDGEKCRTSKDGVILYRDNIHFSKQGALKIISEISLVDKIERLAK